MKNLYLLIIVFSLSFQINTLKAQNWWDWSYQMTESNGSAPVMDAQDNILRIGNGTSGCTVNKYNREGQTIWQKSFAGGGFCITTDEDGNIYTAGPVVDSGLHSANYSGSWEPQFSTTFKVPNNIAKLDADGHVIWSLYCNRQVSVIHVAATGDLFVAGAFFRNPNINPMYDSVILGNISLYAQASGTYGSYYVFAGKIDNNGNVSWFKIFKRENPTGVYDQTPTVGSIVSDNYGNVYLAGANRTGTLYADTFALYASYCSDFMIQLSAATGNVKWAKILRYSDYIIHGTPMGTGATEFAVLNGDGSKGVLMTGQTIAPYTILFGDSVYRPAGKYICSFDSSGNEKWMKFYNAGYSWPKSFYKHRDKYYVGVRGYDTNLDSLAVLDSSFNVIKKLPTPGLQQFTMHDESETIIAICKPYSSSSLCKVLMDYNKVSGYVFEDTNNNGIKDSVETGFSNILVGAPGNRFVTLTDKNGYYECYIDSGTYTIAPVAGVRYHTYAPATGYDVHFTDYANVAAGNNFACTPIPGINDLRITTTATGRSRPGIINYYSTTVKNNGTANANGTASVKLPAYTSFIADTSMSIPVFSSTDSIAFSFTNLLPGEEKQFTFKSQLSALLMTGEIIKVYSYVLPVINDSFPRDNYDTLARRISNSFDPNDKLVFPEGDVNIINKNDPLHYTIRFQNTGNDTAFNVHLIDTLSDKLDITTLEMVSSSHNYTAKIEKGNILHFYFDNIDLVDSFHNEAMSHGYIRFKIKPTSTINIGDNILNNAAIYFDYNKAVMTNTTSTRYISIVLPVVLKNFTAVKNKNAVDLTFSSETELHLSHFEIERSNDGNVFSKLNSIGAKGYSCNYFCTDNSPIEDVNYYRIKLVFTDGSIRYSHVQAVQMKKFKSAVLFPNPVNSILYFTTASTGNLAYKIYSIDGKLYYTGAINNAQQGNITGINTAPLSAGLYFIEIKSKEKTEIMKFLVQHSE